MYFKKTRPPLKKGDKGGFQIPLNLPLEKGEVRSLLIILFLLCFLILLLLGLLHIFSAFSSHFCPPFSNDYLQYLYNPLNPEGQVILGSILKHKMPPF